MRPPQEPLLSHGRLLAGSGATAPGVPVAVRQLAARVMTREREASSGRRPPTHSLLQRLALLAEFEATCQEYPSRADFARRHGLRPDYLRDLIRWACTDAAGARLFVMTSSAAGAGQLTPVARYLLTSLLPAARGEGQHRTF